MKTANSFICKSETPEEVLTPLGFLARFGELVRSGCYQKATRVRPVDMFPMGGHCECVVKLERVGK